MSQLFMKVYFSCLPWSADDDTNKLSTHQWMHLILLLITSTCLLCPECPSSALSMGLVLLLFLCSQDWKCTTGFIIFYLLLNQTAWMTVCWHFTSFTAFIPDIQKGWFMLFQSFLRPHEEGSETGEGPVNITEYKCATKHNFGWIF